MFVSDSVFLEHIIRETNKKLYDSNDGLRSALANEAVAAKRRVSPSFVDDTFPHTHWLYNQIDADSKFFSLVQV